MPNRRPETVIMRTTMARTAGLLAALSGLAALAACQPQANTDPPVAAQPLPAPDAAQPASSQAMEARPTTEASAFTGGEGAYGMPRAPIPYDQLSRYEQQQQALGGNPNNGVAHGPNGVAPGQPGAPRPRAYREGGKEQDAKTRRENDSVFY